MDEIDRANREAEEHLARSLLNHSPATPTFPPSDECIDCGADVEQERRQMGAYLCAECAKFWEAKGGYK